MRFLIDESTGRKLHNRLKEFGYDTLFVGDLFPGSTDEEVLARAETEGRVLITDDKDFGQLVFRLRMPSSGIILLRVHDPKERTEMLLKTIREHDVQGKFTIIELDRIKMRKL